MCVAYTYEIFLEVSASCVQEVSKRVSYHGLGYNGGISAVDWYHWYSVHQPYNAPQWNTRDTKS